MSLFPAYAAENDTEKPTTSNAEWLKNSSFTIDVVGLKKRERTPEKKDKKSKKPKKEKKTKDHRSKTKDVIVPIAVVSEDFTIDKTRTKEFFSVDTISRPSVPRYDKKYSILKKRKPLKKFKRYYAYKLEKNDDEKSAVITKNDLGKKPDKESDENFSGFKQEETMGQTTAVFNRKLAENPEDVNTWLEYVRFQDSVYNFEKTYRKGSIVKGLRVTAERKLAILDKALTHLPNNEEILRERLNICVNVYPSDELYMMLSKLVDKERGNIILWQGLIESRQCSMSHCNTKTVIALYIKCLSTLHQLRRTAKLEKSVLEENILRMLYQCGLFLKQSGLFELLWTLLKMYLDLNVAQEKNRFNLVSSFNDKQLIELEEVILNSQLPLHELWLRIEKLRESCHWLPFSGTENCEDPQRIVFAEDVAELIHPITMPGNTFKLTATILNLLKIPLLPCRHVTMKNLGLDYVPWALDSIESILPIFLNLYPIDLSNKHYMEYTQKLAVGPQYLKPLPGQEEYLIFILEVMSNCVNSLQDHEKTAVSIWWFRFQRILYVLEKDSLVKMSKSLKKKLKTDRKNLLKSESNNVVLYKEYALVEYDLGLLDSCVNVLLTALKMHPYNINAIPEEVLKSSLCSVYRTLIELYLNKMNSLYNPSKSLELLIKLSNGINVEETIEITEEILKETTLKFKHVTLKLLQNETTNLETVQHFLPQFLIDWIICNGWFIYLTKTIEDFCEFLEEILPKMKTFESEVLHEFYVAVLFKTRVETPEGAIYKKLDEVLFKSIELYPNNIFFLSVLSKEQSINCSMAQNFWKVKNLLIKTGHALPNLFLVLISFQRTHQIEASWINTFSGSNMTMDTGLRNRTYALFKTLTNSNMCTRRCGVMWRLYLQFLHENYDPTLCRNAYYSAVEELPWLKALYIDAAIYIPAELPQIQDLLIEKQLRLHVTPEELDILRD